ncbi:19062_t:CDS:1, partial [Dentiscutata erythropus]
SNSKHFLARPVNLLPRKSIRSSVNCYCDKCNSKKVDSCTRDLHSISLNKINFVKQVSSICAKSPTSHIESLTSLIESSINHAECSTNNIESLTNCIESLASCINQSQSSKK